MREDVDETVGIVDDFFREFDVGNVSVFSTDGAVCVCRFYAFSSPICASGCGIQFFVPDDLDAAAGCC